MSHFVSFLNFHHFHLCRFFEACPVANIQCFAVLNMLIVSRLRRSLAFASLFLCLCDAINNFNFQIITNLCGNFTYCTFVSCCWTFRVADFCSVVVYLNPQMVNCLGERASFKFFNVAKNKLFTVRLVSYSFRSDFESFHFNFIKMRRSSVNMLFEMVAY